MDSENLAGNLFHVEVMHGIYLITSDSTGPTENNRSMAPGNPTGNSYLVIGEERALLFDLAVDHPDIRSYAEQMTDKPIQLILSHGHYDHTYHLNQFSEVWLHPEDNKFIQEGMLGMPPVDPRPTLHPIRGGDRIDLGNRILDVINIPGHTTGSIMLLDHQTATLLSGDTGARRLLYGLTDFIPFAIFCTSLQNLLHQDFETMYSAHDRCALPRAHLELMIRLINTELPKTDKTWTYPGLEEMALLEHGDLYSVRYFNMAVPARYLHTSE